MADNITIDITGNETIVTEATIDISIKLCQFSLGYLNNYFKVIEMQLENLMKIFTFSFLTISILYIYIYTFHIYHSLMHF